MLVSCAACSALRRDDVDRCFCGASDSIPSPDPNPDHRRPDDKRS